MTSGVPARYASPMGILDDLRSSISRSLASSAAEQATKSFEDKVEALADDFASAAEKELAEREAARSGRLDALEEAAAGAREERVARKAAAAEELARLKAAAGKAAAGKVDGGGAELDGGPPSREL